MYFFELSESINFEYVLNNSCSVTFICRSNIANRSLILIIMSGIFKILRNQTGTDFDPES